jgi:hypothetical protein
MAQKGKRSERHDESEHRADVTSIPPPDPSERNLRALTVEEASARPVTLGIVLALGMIVVSMIGYVFMKLEEVSTALTRFQAEQTERAKAFEAAQQEDQAKLNAVLTKVNGQFSEQIARMDERVKALHSTTQATLTNTAGP